MEKNKALEFELNPAFQRLKFVNQFPQNESTSTTISSINNTKIEDNIKLKQENRNLRTKLEVLREGSTSGEVSNADLLRRLSNLEKIIYGKD